MVLRLNGTCDVSSFSESCDSASDPISCLDDDNLHSERSELLSSGESGNSGADDDNFAGRFPVGNGPLVNAEVDVAVALKKRVDSNDLNNIRS